MAALEAQVTEKQAWFQANAAGIAPNMVLVLELAKPVQSFAVAAARVGIPLIGEVDGDEFDAADAGFAVFNQRGQEQEGKRVVSHVYLHTFNLRTAETFRRLYVRWRDNGVWPEGTTPWRDVFDCILNVRSWNATDRLRDSGLAEAWQERIEEGATQLEFEADLWFGLQAGQNRRRVAEILGERLAAIGGTIQHESIIEQIGYHGVLGQVPVASVPNLQRIDALEFVQFDGIFELHPVTQAVIRESNELDSVLLAPARNVAPHDELPPIVGLIDGVPMQNHPDLVGDVLIHDPDDLSAQSPVVDRVHGTAMASLIVNGDLSAGEIKLRRPIAVRPVLVPHRSMRGSVEGFPNGRLALDTFHRALRDLINGVHGNEIRVINVSLGDPRRRLINRISPWARFLDWAAYEYRLLFVVSAGNCQDDIPIRLAPNTLADARREDVQNAVLDSSYTEARRRTLLSPAESVNALTIGAAHHDPTEPGATGALIDPLVDSLLPSPITPIGPGYGHAIKPDCLAIGGRQLYREPVVYPAGAEHAVLRLHEYRRIPGVLVAASQSPLEGPGRWYTRGTSVAAALTTRLAAQIYEEVIANAQSGAAMARPYAAVVLKALIAHSATWGESAEQLLSEMLRRNRVPNRKLKENLSRFLGHGRIRPERAFRCTDQRVTVIGFGELRHGDAHVFSFPWPVGLRASAVERHLTVTLATLVPPVPGKYAYRGADVWVNKPTESAQFGLASGDRDHHAVQRGTLQHTRYSGQSAAAFDDGAGLTLQVNCRAVAFDEHALPPVPYALITTLEVAEASAIPVYDQVQIGLRQPVRVPLGPRA